MRPVDFEICTSALRLSAASVEWDRLVYGVPVVQINECRVLNATQALVDYQRFDAWVNDKELGIVSCRLPHDRLVESMFLESQGFRFVEMVLHPTLESLESRTFSNVQLDVKRAAPADIAALQNIARTAFGFERFHVDPRLNRKYADERYGRWVVSSVSHPKQELYKVQDDERLVGLFLIEIMADTSAYWHLTAIAPEWQGQGYGRRVWSAMLNYCKSISCRSVSTTISARNTPVLNLYSQLQFRFKPPEMTYHWVRGFN